MCSGDFFWSLEALEKIKTEGMLETLFVGRFGEIRKAKLRKHWLATPYNHQGLIFKKVIDYSLDYKIASDFDRLFKEKNY